ncbi:MAG: hypothetical protein JNJ70_13035 [Verrucomicrobiales bacterium]|nr:hypothetical protein [Verrucomicrobiales bacterium]
MKRTTAKGTPEGKSSPGHNGEEAPSSEDRSFHSFEDDTYRIADLAVKIMGLVPRMPRDPILPRIGLDESFWDAEFEAAKLRALLLLRGIERNREDIDAYQLFEEGVLMSCEEITVVFKNAGWKGLMSVAPVRNLMARMERQFARYGDELTSLYPHDTQALAEDVLNRIDDIASWEGVRMVFPGFLESLNKFITSLRSQRIGGTTQEAMGELIWFHAFSEWCIVKETVSGKPATKYRAHEIFRFATHEGWEQDSLIKEDAVIRSPVHPKFSLRRGLIFEKFNERESVLTRPYLRHHFDEDTATITPTSDEPDADQMDPATSEGSL